MVRNHSANKKHGKFGRKHQQTRINLELNENEPKISEKLLYLISKIFSDTPDLTGFPDHLLLTPSFYGPILRVAVVIER